MPGGDGNGVQSKEDEKHGTQVSGGNVNTSLVMDPAAMQAQMLQMQQMMQQMMAMQMNSVASTMNLVPGQESQTNVNRKSAAKRPDRPIIEKESSESEWAMFVDAWERYKEVTELPSETRIRYELRSACSREVEKELFDNYGSDLKECTEAELLEKIRSVAVSTVHKEVHRQKFKEIAQFEGESYTHYMGRLRSKAQLCLFSCSTHCTCGREVSMSYSEDAIAAQMIAGIHNKEHQSKVLAETATKETLKEKFDLLLSLETTDKSAAQLGTESRSGLAAQQAGRKFEKCDRCGRGKHYNKKECPASKITCFNCGLVGHMSRVCKKPKKKKERPSSTANQESEESDFLDESQNNASFIFVQSEEQVITCNDTGTGIPHMQWNGKKFVPGKPEPSPRIAVSVRVMREVHVKFGKKEAGRAGSPKQVTCPDTGAQTCTMGVDVLKELGIPVSYLVKTKHRIGGVTQTSLAVLGSIFAEIRKGDEITRQVIYVARNILGLFLSQSALKDLKMIPLNFPHDTVLASSNSEIDDTLAACGCPKRSPTPTLPSEMPFEPADVNREKLEHWILNYYKSSAFNVCPHQPPPAMTGKDMKVTFKNGVEPYAVHTPIPVPHHWKKEVKSNVDRDVSLEVIEPVPQGTPTTWCSRMVVVPKADGTPRRTVDLQKLNAATFRETHHTATPFEHVSLIPPKTLKTVLDAWNGYHSVKLHPESREATSFITEWGRYRYLRAPMGFHASGDAYTKRFDDITSDVERKTRCIDDTILWDMNMESAFWHK